MSGNAHQELVLQLHHVTNPSRTPVVDCLVTNEGEAEITWFENRWICAVCGNELGLRTQLRIHWKDQDGITRLAFL